MAFVDQQVTVDTAHRFACLDVLERTTRDGELHDAFQWRTPPPPVRNAFIDGAGLLRTLTCARTVDDGGIRRPEETKASKKKKLKLPPLALDAMMPLTLSPEAWLSDAGKAFVKLLGELPCPSAWSAKHVSNALERMAKANLEEAVGVKKSEQVW